MAEKRESYWELLRRPEWQRKRLEIMERDEFACRECGSKDKTLNVHHRHYEKGKKPWEYEAFKLVTLCESCHEFRTELDTKLAADAGILGRGELIRVLGYIASVDMISRAKGGKVLRIRIGDSSVGEFCEGMADAYQINPLLIEEFADDGIVVHETMMAVVRHQNSRQYAEDNATFKTDPALRHDNSFATSGSNAPFVGA